MTADELADQYVRDLRSADDKDAEIRRISHSIKSLIYDKDDSPISVEDERRIVDGIRNRLLTENKRVRGEGFTWLLKEADNKRYLELVTMLQALLK